MIKYFYRNSSGGYSIERVFKTITDEIKNKEEIEEVFMPSKRSYPLDMLKNIIYTFRNRNQEGINHVTGHIHDVIIGLYKCKVVLTIHDLVFLDNVKNPFKRFYKWLFWLYIPVKLSDHIVCISSQTKINVLSHINTNKISVIFNPVDSKFKTITRDFNKEKPRILHIGTGWNKNLIRVIKALAKIRCHLRIIGELRTYEIELLEKYHIEYSNLSNLTDDQIIIEYKNCDIVSFPSEYEGFGMPVIEGQRTGRVIVTSKIEPLIEISGSGAEFVDPFDVKSIKTGFLKVINNDNYREEKIKSGLKNSERFLVQEVANKYLILYNELMENKI